MCDGQLLSLHVYLRDFWLEIIKSGCFKSRNISKLLAFNQLSSLNDLKLITRFKSWQRYVICQGKFTKPKFFQQPTSSWQPELIPIPFYSLSPCCEIELCDQFLFISSIIFSFNLQSLHNRYLLISERKLKWVSTYTFLLVDQSKLEAVAKTKINWVNYASVSQMMFHETLGILSIFKFFKHLFTGWGSAEPKLEFWVSVDKKVRNH